MPSSQMVTALRAAASILVQFLCRLSKLYRGLHGTRRMEIRREHFTGVHLSLPSSSPSCAEGQLPHFVPSPASRHLRWLPGPWFARGWSPPTDHSPWLWVLGSQAATCLLHPTTYFLSVHQFNYPAGSPGTDLPSPLLHSLSNGFLSGTVFLMRAEYNLEA